jgi:two-component system, OmpR family, sensor histidine kinase CiaH
MLKTSNLLFVIVLLYTIAALLFWHNSLQKQNKLLSEKDMIINKMTKKNNPEAIAAIENKYKRKRVQYIGEGATFMLFILAGGVLVYLSFRKRLQLTDQQNNFMLSVTHELKTPLAGIKLGLETLGKRKLTDDQHHKIIGNSIYETERLNELCNNILLSTQLDGKQYLAKTQEMNLVDLIHQCVDDFATRYDDIQFKMNTYSHIITYKGDPFLWRMVINNLLENARKYAPNGKAIIVDLYEASEDLIIQIIDEGPGIADLDKKKIFQKFYRTGNENTRVSKGTGLGLFIVKRAIEWHGGSILMANNTPSGNIAIIQIPKHHEH